MLLLLFLASLLDGIFLVLGNGNPRLEELEGKRETFNSFPKVIMLYLLRMVEVWVYGSIAFMLSVLSNSNAFSTGVTFLRCF